MEKYDYRRSITNDIKDWIINDTDLIENEYINKPNYELMDWIYDEIYNEDSITGNGMYYYNTEEKCSEYLSGNFDLLYEAANEFCLDDTNLIITHYESKDLARYFDCIIRCYLLYECIDNALNELNIKRKNK